MSLESEVRDVARDAETEVRRVITYLNDRVVPDIRAHTRTAMRSAADELRKLADRLERRGGAPRQ